MLTLSKKRPTTPTIVLTAIASAYVSATFVLDAHLDYTGDLLTTYPGNFLTALGPLDFFLWLLLAGVLFAALWFAGRFMASYGHAVKKARTASAFSRSLADGSLAEAGSVTPGETMLSPKLTGELTGSRLSDYLSEHRGLVVGLAAVVFGCWLFVFLNYYPGTSMNDQIGIIVNPIASASQHPLLYCLAISGCVNLTQALFQDGSFGFAAFVLVRMAACATIVSTLACWLRWRGAKAPMIWAFVLFFALCPIIADNAICSIKDTLFNFVLLLWIPFFDEYLRRHGALFTYEGEQRRYVVLCVLTGITRNNGLIVAILLIATVLLTGTKRHGMGKVVASSALALVLMFAPSVIARFLPGATYSAAEALGVPLQQLAAVAVSDEGTLTADQLAELDRAVDVSRLPSVYYPVYVDGIKFQGAMHGDYITDHRDKFIQNWIAVGLANPTNFDIYVRAWFSNTYGCWGPFANPQPWQSYFFKQQNNEVFGSNDWYVQTIASYKLESRSLLPAQMATAFKSFWEPLVASPGTGALFIMVLILAVLACHKEGSASRAILPYLPLILLWLSLMLSVPLSGALRYGLSLLLGLPILVCLMILPENRTGEIAATMPRYMRVSDM